MKVNTVVTLDLKELTDLIVASAKSHTKAGAGSSKVSFVFDNKADDPGASASVVGAKVEFSEIAKS